MSKRNMVDYYYDNNNNMIIRAYQERSEETDFLVMAVKDGELTLNGGKLCPYICYGQTGLIRQLGSLNALKC